MKRICTRTAPQHGCTKFALVALAAASLSGCASAWLPITHTAAAQQTDASLGARVREAIHQQTLKPGPSSDAQLPQQQSAQEMLSARRAQTAHHGTMGAGAHTGMGSGMGSGNDSPFSGHR